MPTDCKVPLFYSIPDTVELHVDCFGSSLLHSIVCDTFCAYVVYDDDRGWLGIPDVYESLVYIFRVLYIVEQCSQLGFERGYEYVFHGSGNDAGRSIGGCCGESRETIGLGGQRGRNIILLLIWQESGRDTRHHCPHASPCRSYEIIRWRLGEFQHNGIIVSQLPPFFVLQWLAVTQLR